MISTVKYLAAGAGAVGIAGTAAIFGLPGAGDKTELSVQLEDNFEACLKNDIRFFEGAGAGCYSRAELEALRDKPLLGRGAETVSVSMTHPTDFSAAAKSCETCADFQTMRQEGWYALSTRDMRREAFFVRACGSLELLLQSAKAENSFFDNGSPDEGEMAALEPEHLLRLAGDGAASMTPVSVAKTSAYNWRFEAGDHSTDLQEMANADFDRDGVEEILVFLHSGPAEGTARIHAVALLEKDAPGAALTLSSPQLQGSQGSVGGAP